jgi:hypothetical protein
MTVSTSPMSPFTPKAGIRSANTDVRYGSTLAHIETEYVCCTRGEFVLVLAVNIHSAVWLRAIALCSLF